MNWIVSSLLMFVSSVFLYLLVRKSSLLRIQSAINNLVMFFVPVVVYAVMLVSEQQRIILTGQQFILLVLAALVLSYLGNVFSLKSIEYASNPGYSLVISKSYVVLTTVLAVVFFGAHFSIEKALAILLIVGFSAFIMTTDTAKKKSSNPLWLPYAVGSFFCWGFLSLTAKYLIDQGVPVLVFLTFIGSIVTVLIGMEIFIRKISLKSIITNPWIFVGIGITSTLFNLFLFFAIATAPNVGYVNAINVASISMVTIFSWLLFHDELTKRKFIGVIGVTIGLFWLLVR